jgi:site-specific recombinase XerD
MNSTTRRLSRNSTAMHLLQSGVAFSVIALWLGHESTTTTHRYVEANLEMKQKALARLQEPDTKMSRYQPQGNRVKEIRLR